jgi:sugar/nucleoside kinase (ribokinase family)
MCYDQIVTHDGRRKRSFGGIAHNMMALSGIRDERTTVCPIAKVGANRFDEVRGLAAGVPGVDTSGLVRIDQPLTEVDLTYKSISYREELMRYLPPPLAVNDLAPALESDAVLVNFITGMEIDLEGLRALRSQTRAILHLDVHSKVTRWGPDGSGGQKSWVPFADWREWFGCFDVVQMNEFECEMVLGREVKTEQDFLEAACEMLTAGPMAAIVTLGPLGSVIAHRAEGKQYRFACPAMPVDPVVDTTGCGDCFSAGFCFNYLQSKNAAAANLAANIVAGTNCKYAGLGDLGQARGALDRITEVFPGLGDKVASGWLGELCAGKWGQ